MGLMQALAMLGAGASGYVQGREMYQRDQRQAEDDARLKVLQQREDTQYAQQQADDQAMRNAFAPVTVQSGPVARPIGVADEPSTHDLGISVNGQQYPDMASAQAAADEANAPTARMQRAAAAVQNPMLAAKLVDEAQRSQLTGMQTQLTGMQVQAARRNQAAQQFDDAAHDAIWQGPEATAQFMSDSHADGKGGKVKFQSVTDPKTGEWQIMRVADDGALAPIGGKYTNDDAGRITALYQLSKAVDPKDKMAHVMEVQRAAREGRLTDAQVGFLGARGRYFSAMSDIAADANDFKAGAKGDPMARMSEADKLMLANLNDQLKLINSERVKSRAINMWQPDSPGAKAIEEQERVLLMQRRTLLEKYATPGAAADPAGLRGGAPSTRPPSVMEAISADMRKTGTNDAQIRVANPDAPYVAAQPEPQQAGRRVAQTPVVNFDPGSAVQRRLAAARSEIPARQKAVADAWSAVQAARAQGPMVEVRARSALAAARANLAIAEQRAGLSEAH